jgi:PAS domain S-box-containing protein
MTLLSKIESFLFLGSEATPLTDAADLLLYVSDLVEDRETIKDDLTSIGRLKSLSFEEQDAVAKKIYTRLEKKLCPAKLSQAELRAKIAERFDPRRIRLSFATIFLPEAERGIRVQEDEATETAAKLLRLIGRERLETLIRERSTESILHGLLLDESGRLDFSVPEKRFLKLPPPWLKLIERALVLLNADLLKVLSQETRAKRNVIPLTMEAKKTLQALGMANLSRVGVVRDLEQTLLTKKGSTLPVVVTASALKNSAGVTLGAVIAAKDLREIKKLQEEKLWIVEKAKEDIEREKDKLEVTLQSIGDGAIALDTERRIVFINRHAEQITGVAAGEALGKNYQQVLRIVNEKNHTEDYSFIEEALGHVGHTPTHIPNNSLLIAKDEKEIAISYNAAPIKSPTGMITGCVVIFRDVSEERRIDNAKTEFISIASHQLRTPLTAIRWNAELLMEMAKEYFTADQMQYIIDMHESTKHMIEIVNGLLNISRIEAERLTVNPVSVDCVALVQTILKNVQPLVAKKEHNISVQAAPGLPMLTTDPKILTELLANLVSNAIKYTPPKGKIEINLSLKDADMMFTVKDNGYGIPKGQQKRIFEKFFRGENVVKLDTEGTGLGLYIVHQLAILLGGRAWFESEENRGSTFFFTIPLTGSKQKKGEVSVA